MCIETISGFMECLLEDKEGTVMVGFLDNLLTSAVGFPLDRELCIERAHQALV